MPRPSPGTTQLGTSCVCVLQLSMFFFDPDGNEVEITTWDCERDDRCSRFGQISDRSIRGDGSVPASRL